MSLVRPVRHRTARIASIDVRALDCGLHVDLIEDHSGPGNSKLPIRAIARFTAVLEWKGPESNSALRRVTALSVRSEEALLHRTRFTHAAAGLTVDAPALSELLAQAQAPTGARVRLVSAAWSHLVLIDTEHRLSGEVDGEWTVYREPARLALSTASA
ncbi:hypothetical protein GCM10027449_24950 [Sinomonas notoginsengisoli]|uniref:hypothetical protein n=1 Tax=Sinomonas notoginsengisoli TaxID=1457311 RepID=UPI001F1A0276|nr:hypothetical protein [Sinomonas notoginsengisoli]